MNALPVLDERGASDSPNPAELPAISSVEQAAMLQKRLGELFLRISPGPRTDDRTGSLHPESGYLLPGLPAWPLLPELWWSAGQRAWIARQLVQHAYLLSPANRAWLLTGEVVGRGPDCEPLLRGVRTVGVLEQGALWEAESIYAAWRCRDFR